MSPKVILVGLSMCRRFRRLQFRLSHPHTLLAHDRMETDAARTGKD